MNAQKPSFFVPALIGGAVAGVLSGVPLLGCLCCLWIIGGAMLSAYLLAKDSPILLTSADGAIVGIFSGIIAAIVEAFISLPFQPFNAEFISKFMERFSQYAEDMPSGWESLLERSTTGISISMFFLGLVISAFIFAALGALGGIIGVSLFGKKENRSQGA